MVRAGTGLGLRISVRERDGRNRTLTLRGKQMLASFRISLPLSTIGVGRYTVQAVVVEPGGTQAAFGRNYFALQASAIPLR